MEFHSRVFSASRPLSPPGCSAAPHPGCRCTVVKEGKTHDRLNSFTKVPDRYVQSIVQFSCSYIHKNKVGKLSNFRRQKRANYDVTLREILHHCKVKTSFASLLYGMQKATQMNSLIKKKALVCRCALNVEVRATD